MKKIYKSGNYVIVENGTSVLEYAIGKTVYNLDNSVYYIVEQSGQGIGKTGIPISDISNWFDEAGSTAYTEATLVTFLRTNTGFSSGGGNGSGVADSNLSETVLLNTNATIAGGQTAGVPDPSGNVSGWHFTNDGTNKINWYYVADTTQDGMTVSDVKGQYCLIVANNSQQPYFNLYTRRQFDGQDAGTWYRSRITYNTNNVLDNYTGQPVILYWGQDPNVFTNIPHIEMTYEGFSSVGPQDPAEEVLTGALNTSTNPNPELYSFTVSNLGYFKGAERIDFLLEAYPVTQIPNNFFRGFVTTDEISLLNNDSAYLDFVGNKDTETIWQFNGVEYIDSGVTVNLSNIGATQEASVNGLLVQSIQGEATIGTLDYMLQSVSPNPVYYKNNSSRAGRGGITFEEKIYNAGEWFTFENLKLGLGGKGWGISLTKAKADDGTINVDADDLGTNFDILGTHSNYETDLYTNHNTVGKGAVVTAQFYPTYLWTYNVTNSKSWVYNSNWGKMNNSIDLGGFYNNPSGGSLRIGIDDDLKFKLQVIDLATGEWTTVMYSNEPADPRVDGYRCVFNPYYGYSQLNVFPSVTTVGTSNGGATPTYANTHHVELDGINDYLTVTGAHADVLDFTKTWSISMELKNLSSVSDGSYLTLFKRGSNEVTLRRGGSNWGIYNYCNGSAIAQANTRVKPENSKILITCDGTRIKYYVNGVAKANMLINANISQNNPIGDLEIGKSGNIGAYWYGGLNNFAPFLIDISASSDAISELFSTEDLTQLSYYSDSDDFVTLGEGTYPNDSGLKGKITSTLINGTEEDFKTN